MYSCRGNTNGAKSPVICIYLHILQVKWPHPAAQIALYNKYIRNTTAQNNFTAINQAINLAETGKEKEAILKIKSTDEITRNFVHVTIYYPFAGVTNVTELPALSIETLGGAIGGVLNLWVGFTLFTLIEIIDFLGKVLWNMLRGNRNQNVVKIKVEEKEKQ